MHVKNIENELEVVQNNYNDNLIKDMEKLSTLLENDDKILENNKAITKVNKEMQKISAKDIYNVATILLDEKPTSTKTDLIYQIAKRISENSKSRLLKSVGKEIAHDIEKERRQNK